MDGRGVLLALRSQSEKIVFTGKNRTASLRPLRVGTDLWTMIQTRTRVHGVSRLRTTAIGGTGSGIAGDDGPCPSLALGSQST